MRGLFVVPSMFLAASALAEEVWVPPTVLEPAWTTSINEAMPGYVLRQCGVVLSVYRGVLTQCSLLDAERRDVGYVTQAHEGSSILCGWGERPEALFDDFVLDTASGVFLPLSGDNACPAPVRWDMVEP